MSWTIIVSMKFCAAHYLQNYRDKCENLHGHTYKIVIYIAGNKLNNTGIIYDFKEIKEYLKEILPDHRCLNEIYSFNPTAENLAYYFYHIIKQKYPVKKVEIWEDETQAASYEENSD
ncbi:MAG: 6-carboxytetrahydropterin synthase QueD [candidate division WOR-3 bacterium]|nr:6-carboxytetrahydropterin synthase QueD [candidate division WOR-3 bacterium]